MCERRRSSQNDNKNGRGKLAGTFDHIATLSSYLNRREGVHGNGRSGVAKDEWGVAEERMDGTEEENKK